jgi:hypothetical protein
MNTKVDRLRSFANKVAPSKPERSRALRAADAGMSHAVAAQARDPESVIRSSQLVVVYPCV